MSCRIRLVLAMHNHQPVGNFGGVFEDAYRNSYAPFLDVIETYPGIPVVLHTSGSLMEWLVEAHPDYIDRVRMLVDRGQVEILGGPFYEPILAEIPSRDRIGQMTAYSEYLERLLGSRIRGMWVPERVWEQSFASDIARSGIEYTILDDFHFRSAGLESDQLHGYYLTEDDGLLVKIFPGSERLRYTIPFADPHVTIDHLRSIADRFPNSVVTLGDDGEKFGTWPGTYKHVYQDGWLRRFLDELGRNADWLKVTTLAEVVDCVAPAGKCYIPDSSYREMTEWALPTPQQAEFRHIVHEKESDPAFQQVKHLLRGGFWRNFRVKYPEANEMYTRMLQVSQRLDDALKGPAARNYSDIVNRARTELYRAQCNCPYWHGAFGGLYLPHLRNAVFHRLIHAESLLEESSERRGRWVEIQAADYDLDARKEVRIAGDRLVAYLAPGRGGHLYELDVRGAKVNLLATLNRRPEPYHETIRNAGRQQHNGEAQVASIHDTVSFKQPGLDKRIVYDNWPRKSLVDHFLQPGLTLEAFQAGRGAVGDFVGGVYETRLRRSPQHVEAHMTRYGHVGPYRVHVLKTVALDASSGGLLQIGYVLENLPAGVPIHFAVEFNFAAMAAGATDRYFYDATGTQLGQLETVQSLCAADRIGLVDEWLGVDAAIDLSRPADIWTFPIQTISQSESGFELVHQSSAVVPHWEFIASGDGRWSVDIALSIDTSAAQARALREAEITA